MTFRNSSRLLGPIPWLELHAQRYASFLSSQSRTNSSASKKSGKTETFSDIKDWGKLKDYVGASVLSNFSALNLELPKKLVPSYEKIFSGIVTRKEPRTESPQVSQEDVKADNRKSAKRKMEIADVKTERHTFEQAMEEMQGITTFAGEQEYIPKSVAVSNPLTKEETECVSDKESEIKTHLKVLPKQTNVMQEAKKKLAQKKACVSKVAIDQRTKALVLNIKKASSHASKLIRAEELAEHLLQYPDSRAIAVKGKAISSLLKIRAKCNSDTVLLGQIRETLAILGHVDPVSGRGIRILSIDGGGTRGLVALETLKKIEQLCNKEIHEIFDYICGVSTGSLIAAMVSIYKVPLDECEEVYKRCSTEMFSRSKVAGAAKLFYSHAFYDASVWENILRENMQDTTTIETAKAQGVPKYSAISCLVNGSVLTNYLFRNYNLPPHVQSHYPGSIKYKLWEAIRASSAAPGYYEECKLDEHIHQDGGLLSNNPTAIALHECKLLWPHEPIQCVISLGTGRYEGTSEEEAGSYSSLKQKLMKIVQSATDTEAVHTVLGDLLPPNTYFRFNPYVSEDFLLDEIREDKQQQIQQDAQMYLRKNDHKVSLAAKQLLLKRKPHQKCVDWLKLQNDIVH